MQTSSTWLYGGALLLVLIVAMGGIYLSLSGYFGRGELETKSYYAALQSIELDNRGNKNPSPILKENVNGTGLDVLGILGGDAAKTRVWVILNLASSEGQPIVMPQGIPIEVDCTLLNSIISRKQVAKPVSQYLIRECTLRRTDGR
jgi:hypothetical protein